VLVRLIDLTVVVDDRGRLVASNFSDSIPFQPKRVFIISDSAPGVVRGGHSHLECHQLLIGVSGRIAVYWEDVRGENQHVLLPGGPAIYIPPLVWAKQEYLTENSALTVLASHEYRTEDYVDDPDESRRLRGLRT
jgi:dTDP-4-dehydrorhamnose 3,5-epimerase-like enzyme